MKEFSLQDIKEFMPYLLHCKNNKAYSMERQEFILKAVAEKIIKDNMKCEHCKYYQDNNNGYPNADCKWNSNETPNSDDFCSYFEQKE